MTVWAPRSRTVSTIERRARATNESITSSALTSITSPRERYLPTSSVSSPRSSTTSLSVRSERIAAMR
jgi:hypothetical protein